MLRRPRSLHAGRSLPATSRPAAPRGSPPSRTTSRTTSGVSLPGSSRVRWSTCREPAQLGPWEAPEPSTRDPASPASSISSRPPPAVSAARGPKTSIRRRITPIKSASSSASERLQQRRMVRPSAWRPAISVLTSRAPAGSSPEVGSSRKITRGSCSTARISARRCFIPFDQVPNGFSRASQRSRRRSQCSMRDRRVAPSRPYSPPKSSRFARPLIRS